MRLVIGLQNGRRGGNGGEGSISERGQISPRFVAAVPVLELERRERPLLRLHEQAVQLGVAVSPVRGTDLGREEDVRQLLVAVDVNEKVAAGFFELFEDAKHLGCNGESACVGVYDMCRSVCRGVWEQGGRGWQASIRARSAAGNYSIAENLEKNPWVDH